MWAVAVFANINTEERSHLSATCTNKFAKTSVSYFDYSHIEQ